MGSIPIGTTFMKIAICGSMEFAKEMIELKKKLEGLGHVAVLPNNVEKYALGNKKVETKWDKIEGDLIKNYYEEIKKSDGVLVVNVTKNGIENYIGGNALIEAAFAHVLSKRVYLLNSIPKMNYAGEIESMNPIILNGDVSKIKE